DPGYQAWHAARRAACAAPDEHAPSVPGCAADAPPPAAPFALCGDGPLTESELLACGALCFDPWVAASAADLAGALPPTRLVAVDRAVGFCFAERGPDGFDVTLCFDWQGAPLPEGAVQEPLPPLRATQGQLLTVALDSGLPRCRWHRVEVDADLPFGTSL